jgi:hypothetical protein
MVVVSAGIGVLSVRRANWRIGVISYSASSMARSLSRKSVLQQVNSQHNFQWIWVATAASHQIVRLDQCHKARPGHDEIHFGKKALTTGLLALAGVFEIRKLIWLMASFGAAGRRMISAQVAGQVQI